MKTLIFETAVKELKNTFTTSNEISEVWNIKAPVMKKVLYGVEIQKPTSYRVYKTAGGTQRTWVFGAIEMNPNRFNVNEIAK